MAVEISKEDFEECVENFCPMENMADVLGCEEKDLERFCKREYGMPFKTVYSKLSNRADFYCRRAFVNLAKQGNNATIKIVAEHFMNLKDKEEKENTQIVIFNGNMPITEDYEHDGIVEDREEDICGSDD